MKEGGYGEEKDRRRKKGRDRDERERGNAGRERICWEVKRNEGGRERGRGYDGGKRVREKMKGEWERRRE